MPPAIRDRCTARAHKLSDAADMRRSRIAQDTARLMDALRPRRTTRSTARNDPDPSDLDDQKAEAPGSPPLLKRKRAVTTVDVVPGPIDARDGNDGRFPRKPRRQPAKQIKGEHGEIRVEPPPDWEKVYNLIAEMRKTWPAAVDTMGCESLADPTQSPRDQRFQTLVALMLSSQTKDTVTSVAIKNLQQGMPGGFNLESTIAIAPDQLNKMIEKVGFHNNKTKYIQAAAQICKDKFGGDIPDTIEGLVSLPGVGPKMGYLCLSAAWGKDEGIGVDVHVHRITNLLAWHKTKNPEETRAALESWLPRDKWHDINHLLVGFGQTFCPPVGRKCEQCRLAQEGLCPSAVVATVKKAKREIKIDQDGSGSLVGHVAVKQEEVEIEAKDISATVKRELPDIEDAA